MSSTFTIDLEIVFDDKNPESVLFHAENAARAIYNACLNECLKRLHKLEHDLRYQELLKLRKKAKLNDKSVSVYNAEIKEITLNYGFSEYQLHEYVIAPKYHFNNLGIDEAQKLATRAFNAVNNLRLKKAKKVYFQSKQYSTSFEGKSRNSKLHFKDGKLCFGKYKFDVIVKDMYQFNALKHRVKYVRVLRRVIRNKNRWYAQLVLEGVPDKQIKTCDNNVGLDIGTSTVAISSPTCASLKELAKGVDKNEKRIKRIQRALERSKRQTNPQNYNPDGTIRKNTKTFKKVWNYSKRYNHLKAILKEEHRKAKVKRKLSHEKLANEIIEQGSNIKVEDMNFKALSKRSKNTTKNKNGKINSKKRFGKVIGNRAPAMLLSIIDRKLHYINKQLIKIDTTKIKASQYNPLTGEYIKHSLKDRLIKLLYGVIVQRDMLSAFIIEHVEGDEIINALEDFDRFKRLQDEFITYLKQTNQLIWYIS